MLAHQFLFVLRCNKYPLVCRIVLYSETYSEAAVRVCITTKSMLLLFYFYCIAPYFEASTSPVGWALIVSDLKWYGMVNSAGTNATTILILIDVKTRVKEKKERSQDARPIFVL